MAFKATHDAQGRFLFNGRTERKRRWDVLDDTALPPWMSLSGTGGSVSVVPIGTTPGEGYCEFANSTSGATARLDMVFGSTGGVHLDKFEEIMMNIYDLRVLQNSSAGSDLGSNLSFRMGVFTSPGRGFYYQQSGNLRKSSLYSFNGSTTAENKLAENNTDGSGGFVINDTGFVGMSMKNLGLVARRDRSPGGGGRLYVNSGTLDSIHDVLEVPAAAWPTTQAGVCLEITNHNGQLAGIRFSSLELILRSG